MAAAVESKLENGFIWNQGPARSNRRLLATLYAYNVAVKPERWRYRSETICPIVPEAVPQGDEEDENERDGWDL